MKAPCWDNDPCPYRKELVEKYGNCHNEHCPLGWMTYEELRNNEYQKRKGLCDIGIPTYTMEKGIKVHQQLFKGSK